jgi:hypothetical protein
MTMNTAPCSRTHQGPVPKFAAKPRAKAASATTAASTAPWALATVPTAVATAMHSAASSMGVIWKRVRRWNAPNPAENAPADANSAALGRPAIRPMAMASTTPGAQ